MNSVWERCAQAVLTRHMAIRRKRDHMVVDYCACWDGGCGLVSESASLLKKRYLLSILDLKRSTYEF